MGNAEINSPDTETMFELAEPLDLSTQEWLITKLEHEPGIKFAEFLHDKPDHLRVIYASSAFSVLTLLDTIQLHHIHTQVVSNSDDVGSP